MYTYYYVDRVDQLHVHNYYSLCVIVIKDSLLCFIFAVIFYSCPLMGENCGHCLSIQDQFNCVYCEDAAACLLDKFCAAENTLRGIGDFGDCELPKINSVSHSSSNLSK